MLFVWGLPGIGAGVAGFFAAVSLTREHDEHLLRLVELLVAPCAVLIGAAIVAITFATDWDRTPKQARRYDELVISSGFLAVFAVLAIAAAGVYVALAPTSDGSIPTDADDVEAAGVAATTLLGLSVGGLITHLGRVVVFVRYQTRALADD